VYSQSVGSSDVFLGMSGKWTCAFPVLLQPLLTRRSRQRPVEHELRPFDGELLPPPPLPLPRLLTMTVIAALQVSVEMPGTAFKDVSLDVQGEQFLVRAPHYKLALHLQHAVDDKQVSACLAGW
jgi:hypothetical protein